MALKVRATVQWLGKGKSLVEKNPIDPKRLRDFELEMALEVERRAKLLANFSQGYQTGRLKNSIESGRDEDGAFVKTNVEYAGFVEFGTGTRGAATDPGPTPPWYQHGAKAGMAAQPFLRPAVHEVSGKAADVLRRTK